jgi:hypothetical protein
MACLAMCIWLKVYFILEIARITSFALVCNLWDFGVVGPRRLKVINCAL